MSKVKILQDANPMLYPCSRHSCRDESVTVTVSEGTGAINGWCVSHALPVLHPQLVA